MGSNEGLTQYVARAKDIRDQLITAGYEVREDEVTLSVLAGLPKEYEMVITVLESSDEMPGLDEVLPKLMHVEQRMDLEPGARAYFAKSKERYQGGAKHHSKECWYCGLKGHVQSSCRKKAYDEKQAGGATSLTAVAV